MQQPIVLCKRNRSTQQPVTSWCQVPAIFNLRRFVIWTSKYCTCWYNDVSRWFTAVFSPSFVCRACLAFGCSCFVPSLRWNEQVRISICFHCSRYRTFLREISLCLPLRQTPRISAVVLYQVHLVFLRVYANLNCCVSLSRNYITDIVCVVGMSVNFDIEK